MAVNDDDRVSNRPEDDGNDRPKRSRRRDEFEDEGREERPRRRSIRNEGDATGGLIPYKNGMALGAYYSGVFGLISCFILLGFFGIVPIILGIMGLKYAKQHPEARGQVHAIVGIVLGAIELLTFLAQVGIFIAAAVGQK
jgi:hypothetical protein